MYLKTKYRHTKDKRFLIRYGLLEQNNFLFKWNTKQ